MFKLSSLVGSILQVVPSTAPHWHWLLEVIGNMVSAQPLVYQTEQKCSNNMAVVEIGLAQVQKVLSCSDLKRIKQVKFVLPGFVKRNDGDDGVEGLQQAVDVLIRVAEAAEEFPLTWVVALGKEDKILSLPASRKHLLTQDATKCVHAMQMRRDLLSMPKEAWQDGNMGELGLERLTSAFSLFKDQAPLEKIGVCGEEAFNTMCQNLFTGLKATIDVLAKGVETTKADMKETYVKFSPILDKLEPWEFEDLAWMFNESKENDAMVQSLHSGFLPSFFRLWKSFGRTWRVANMFNQLRL